MMRSISTLGLVAALAVGCSASPVPPARMASAETAVQSAREAGAERSPEASRHLTLAEDELGKAKMLNSKGKTDEAEQALTRSQSDAALAAALAREAEQRAKSGSMNQTTPSTQP